MDFTVAGCCNFKNLRSGISPGVVPFSVQQETSFESSVHLLKH